ncbi:extracellular solute-binding protein [Paenibacillus yanchengensis]|uniref:Extracellular solute-binding protein n=1 Tax=Paenibacillus yanchengensis TaxID=2035833 RepID=A0ABW4YHL6_9BACL
MKRPYFVIISCFISMLLLLSACSQNVPTANNTNDNNGKNSTTDSNNVTGPTVNPPGQFPIVDEKITLRVAVNGNPLVEDFKTNEYTQYLEEKTNIKVEWIVLDPQSSQEQLNLILIGGELPDVIMNMNISPEQQMIYGEQGIFVSFTELIEQYGENTKQIFQEMPEVKEAITAPGNRIFSLPYINECIHCSMNFKMYVYQPWLEKLQLEEPTTLDEFYDMLVAFKTLDPNGNNKADEIPMTASPGQPRSIIDPFIMNSFIYDDGMKRMIVEDGKIDVVYNKPEWQAGLQYLNKLYKAGLIAEQSFTQDNESYKKLIENPGINIVGAAPAHSPSTITIVEGESNRWIEFQPIAPLKGPSGEQNAFWNPYDKIKGGNFIMTSANKYPEATMRWADYMYEFENGLRSNFGTEGKSWSKPESGDVGRDGEPAQYRLLVPHGRVQNESWAQFGLNYRTDKQHYAGQAVLSELDKEKMYFDVTMEKYHPYIPNIETIVPPLFFTPEDSQALAELDKTINDYVNHMIANFITGESDLDKGWNNYINTLNGMELEKYIAIYQKAYDEKMTQ